MTSYNVIKLAAYFYKMAVYYYKMTVCYYNNMFSRSAVLFCKWSSPLEAWYLCFIKPQMNLRIYHNCSFKGLQGGLNFLNIYPHFYNYSTLLLTIPNIFCVVAHNVEKCSELLLTKLIIFQCSTPQSGKVL